ncbi:MAG: hypothetical protein F6K39_28255 [Okeania sp. SIO3B3]|nr:hypothetical protein [Okeania sp. SIO3B3]
MFTSPCTDFEYNVPTYSQAQENVEKFLRNGITPYCYGLLLLILNT